MWSFIVDFRRYLFDVRFENPYRCWKALAEIFHGHCYYYLEISTKIHNKIAHYGGSDLTNSLRFHIWNRGCNTIEPEVIPFKIPAVVRWVSAMTRVLRKPVCISYELAFGLLLASEAPCLPSEGVRCAALAAPLRWGSQMRRSGEGSQSAEEALFTIINLNATRIWGTLLPSVEGVRCAALAAPSLRESDAALRRGFSERWGSSIHYY